MSMTALNRRHMLGMMMASLAVPACASANGQTPGMMQGSGAMAASLDTTALPSLARASVIHDAVLLLVTDADVTGEWQETLLPLPVDKPFEFSYLYGAASLGDDRRLVKATLTRIRDGWEGRKKAFADIQRHKGQMLERELSIMVGWAANRAAGPILFSDAPEGDDGVLAVDGAYLRQMAGIDTIDEARARRVIRVLYERAFIAMHTIEPDLDGWGGLDVAAMHEVDPTVKDVNRFMDDYVAWIESVDGQADRLARAMATPAPAGFAGGNAFYDEGDEILSHVERLRVGLGLPHEPGRWAGGGSQSVYGRAVSAAYGNARTVLDVARGNSALDTLDTL